MYTFTFVHCWGNNAVGQLGQPLSLSTSATPLRVSGVTQPSRLTCGQQHSCVVDGNTPKCWGLNSTGQLGNGSTTSSYTPVVVNTPYAYRQLAAGYDHTCALVSQDNSANNLIQCWGNNGNGQLGVNDTNTRLTPATLTQKGWIYVTAGTAVTCAINGSVWCWGANDMGQLGTGNTFMYYVPMPSCSTTGFTQVTSWGKTTCGIDGSGLMWCWGDGTSGQMGNNSYFGVNLWPVRVVNPYSTTFISISSGGDHVCGTDVSWQAYCWGNNASGELGYGGMIQQNTAKLYQAITALNGIASAKVGITLFHVITVSPNPADHPPPPKSPKPHWRRQLL
ncbi:hypothetical protein H632_c170p0 [Helicosporidium sp. ATCC 50920]|nr:hypothetical protein H632_c170p0 [Helicosporidium sp. ATCC 50920]|eukprot:KDD76587.1 hypothetical protein H632_c170p0 [Helicosporidium sp. ATCC 50920]